MGTAITATETMRRMRTMRVEGNEVALCDSIIKIFYVSKLDKHQVPMEFKGEVIYHNGQFDEPITLDDILKKHPTVDLVISESGLHGEIYRYGNHGSFWEKIGNTDGFA